MTASPVTPISPGATAMTTRGGTHFCDGLTRKLPNDSFVNTPGQSLSAGLPENVDARVIAFKSCERDAVYAGRQDGVYRSIDFGAALHDIEVGRY